MKRILSGLAAVAVFHCANAGVYVELVDRDLKTGKTVPEQKMYVQAGSGRFVDAEGNAVIIKGETLYVVDERDKSYIVLDKASMEKLAAAMKSAMDQAKEQLAKLPPEQRAQVEQMMGGRMEGMAEGQKLTVDVIDTGKSDKVDGRSCKVWDLKRNGTLDEQLCVVPFNSLPGKENIQEVFGKFARIFDEMAKSVPMMGGNMGTEFQALNKVNGFPMRTRSYERDKLVDNEQVVTVWREEAIPASTFEIPAGYRRKTMENGPGGL